MMYILLLLLFPSHPRTFPYPLVRVRTYVCIISLTRGFFFFLINRQHASLNRVVLTRLMVRSCGGSYDGHAILRRPLYTRHNAYGVSFSIISLSSLSHLSLSFFSWSKLLKHIITDTHRIYASGVFAALNYCDRAFVVRWNSLKTPFSVGDRTFPIRVNVKKHWKTCTIGQDAILFGGSRTILVIV